MKFEVGQKVGIVDQKKFYDDLKIGKFYVGEIYEVKPYGEGFLYRAKTPDGEIYTGFDININSSPYEFVDLYYLSNTLRRLGKEQIAAGTYLIDKANKLY